MPIELLQLLHRAIISMYIMLMTLDMITDMLTWWWANADLFVGDVYVDGVVEVAVGDDDDQIGAYRHCL